MFGHNHYDYSPDFRGGAEQTPMFLPPLAVPEHECVSSLRSEMTSSGCSSYGGSPTSITSYGGACMIPRSNSFHKNMEVYSPMYSSPPGYFECESSAVRKVLSTRDLQSRSPLVNESSIIESMNRANPYSPEEKKERIERYRSKRNLRNFNKKIKYECRKTLADSRPRIRGRFARNDEIKTASTQAQSQFQWGDNSSNNNTTSLEEDDEYDQDVDEDNWINFLDAFSANLLP